MQFFTPRGRRRGNALRELLRWLGQATGSLEVALLRQGDLLGRLFDVDASVVVGRSFGVASGAALRVEAVRGLIRRSLEADRSVVEVEPGVMVTSTDDEASDHSEQWLLLHFVAEREDFWWVGRRCVDKRRNPAREDTDPRLDIWGVETLRDAGLVLEYVSGLMRARGLGERESATTSERTFHAIFHASPDGIVLTDDQMTILVANQAAESLLGYAVGGLVGKRLHEILEFQSLDARGKAFRASVQHTSARLSLTLVARNGEHIPIESHSVANVLPSIHLLTWRDLRSRISAEREKAATQEQMQNMQRLETVGLMAGGIAHDFNNLLAVMMVNLDTARAVMVSPEPELSSALDGVEKAARRAGELTRQLLTYAGRGTRRIDSVDVSSIVEETVGLFRASIPRSATLELVPAKDLPRVDGDSSQLRQVVMNLVSNAVDALPSSRGHVTVLTQQREISADAAANVDAAWATEPVAPGSYVSIRVIDEGVGIAPDVLPKIFDPFFTTKASPGRGLGLATLLGIVRAHRGFILVESTIGRGTSFDVLFPRSHQRADSPLGPVSSKRATTLGLSVLLLEDEVLLGDRLASLLRSRGHRVTLATTASSAERYAMGNNDFDLFIFDVSLPDKDGPTLLGELHQRGKAKPTVLMSGHAAEDVLDRVKGIPFVAFAPKPFRVAELEQLIRGVIESSRESVIG
ncbi:MAG: ATP-binding protein [Polyangiaceae bacterium]